MARFTLHVADIEAKGRRDYHFAVPAEWLAEALADTELRPATGEPGELSVSAKKLGDDVYLDGHLRAAVRLPCARCGEDMTLAIDLPLQQFLSPRPDTPSPMPEELELTPEDLDRDYYAGETIELDALVREQILLEVPMRPAHEGGCDPEVEKILASSSESPKKESPFAALLSLKDQAKKGE